MSAVVLLSHRTTSAQREAVDAACARAGVSCVRWHIGDAFLPDSSLVVAELGAGERTIPSDVVALVDAAGEAATLLLLSNEPLVRPSVSLQNGRVVVVAGPHRTECLYRHVRMLVGTASSECERESVRPWSWSAELSVSSPVSRVDDRTLTAVVPFGAELEQAARAAAFDRMMKADEDTDEARFDDLLGSSAGVVHLSERAARWLVYWPRSGGSDGRVGGTLWLYSSSRFPSFYDLGMAASVAHPSPIRLGAQSGDTLLALSCAIPEAAARTRTSEIEALTHLMSEGGPVLLSRLRDQERMAGGPHLRGLIAEVR